MMSAHCKPEEWKQSALCLFGRTHTVCSTTVLPLLLLLLSSLAHRSHQRKLGIGWCRERLPGALALARPLDARLSRLDHSCATTFCSPRLRPARDSFFGTSPPAAPERLDLHRHASIQVQARTLINHTARGECRVRCQQDAC